MGDFRDLARKYINAGLWVIPVSSMKQPSIGNWKDLQTRPMTEQEINKSFKRCHGMALLMGGKPNLFAADFDLKYSLNPNLYDEIKEKIPIEILKKTYVQGTKNKGFHWIYKIPESRLVGNEKYANRYTTAFEKHKIYLEYYSDPKTRDVAIKTAANHKSLVLLESRSGSPDKCGGYVLMPPTEGYSLIYGRISQLGVLTEEEYDFLIEVFRSFNEVKELGKVDSKSYDGTDWKLSPWDDYNERGDIAELLSGIGWTIMDENVKNIRFKRPGAESGSSALFDKDTRIFNCFSTSTSLSVDKGYNAAGLFTEIECDGDSKLAYRSLIDLDFGIK
jgi:hypothetical protein